MKKLIITGICSFVAGVCLSWGIFRSASDPEVKDVTTIQKSGEKITHSNFKYSGDTIKFDTNAEGEGSASTEIPKANIPEAAAWNNKVHSVQFNLYLYDGVKAGLSYWHRWGGIEAGGGVVFNTKSAGLQGGVKYLW